MPVAAPQARSRARMLAKAALALCAAGLLVSGALSAYVSFLVTDLFRLNRECQQEGYYMADFEFKMLGFAYLFDRGRYLEALTGIRRLHEELKARKALVKIPVFEDKQQELEFYRSLQNPRTGAFMDDSFPLCTWDGPTGNVLAHLEALAQATGQPLRLKYRLKYLDEINTPEKLIAFLEDVSRVGWIASRFPQTSFHFARDLLDYATEDNVLERNQLYSFSAAWKQAMLQWFYNNQDPATGLWGPKSRYSGQLVRLDLHNSASIVKAFVDSEGNDIHPSFPLRYKPQLFATTLRVMSRPPPAAAELDAWHEWVLTMGRGTALLLRYLWKDASAEDRETARKLIAQYMRTRAEKCFIDSEGAFAYYPGSREATLDGTSSAISTYFEVGAFSPDRQRVLWGGPEQTCVTLGEFALEAVAAENLAPLLNQPDLNSVRLYPGTPDPAGLATGAAGLFYPRATPVRDAVELAFRVRHWLERTPQSMGNWVSRQALSDRMLTTGIKPVPVSIGQIPLAQINSVLQQNGTATLIGFDVLQTPRWKITFHLPQTSRPAARAPLLPAGSSVAAAGARLP